jgi:hypothetical protein
MEGYYLVPKDIPNESFIFNQGPAIYVSIFYYVLD